MENCADEEDDDDGDDDESSWNHFSIKVFFYVHWRFTGLPGKGEGYRYSSLPLPPTMEL